MLKGSIVALVTPMRADGTIDWPAWDRLLDFHAEQGTDGVVVAGTTGESATLEADEHAELVASARRRLPRRMPVLAGSGSNSTRHTIELSQRMQAAGADALLVVTPYYNKPTQRGLEAHFRAVADSVAIPVVLYNVPGRTAVDMLPQTIVSLATHPRIVGVKEATGIVSRAHDILAAAGSDFVVLSGDDVTLVELMEAGARGIISVTANVAPRAMHDLCEVALAGRVQEARAIDSTLRNLHKALFLESNPIPVKWAVAQLGLIGEGIRLPLTAFAAEFQEALTAAMTEAGVRIA